MTASLPIGLPFGLPDVPDDPNVVNRSVVQTMLSQSMVLATVFRLAADRIFFFGAHAPGGQEVTHNYISVDVANNFTFSNTTGYHQELDIIQYLGFTDRFFAGPLQNSLRLRQGEKVSVVTLVSAANTFNFNPHDAPLYEALQRAYIVSNTFSFTNEVIGAAFLDVFNDFSFTEIVDSSATVYERASTHSVIKQHLTYHVTGGPECDGDKQYTPFVGESDDGTFPVVPEVPPTLSTGTLTLLYTIQNPFQQHQVILRNPAFGNDDTIRFAKIDRETIGGTRKIFSDLDWAETQTLTLRIESIDKDPACGIQVQDLINFLNLSLGKMIQLTDWEGRIWDGTIITEKTEFVEADTGLAFNMVFEGVLQ